jgi:hypothetical protein
MRPLVALPLAALLLFAPGQGSAQARARVAPERGAVGEAVHWCMFNRPCNWSSHATIAAGIVWGLRRVDVAPEHAAAVAALVFVGKEVRDHLKWGNVLGTPDSMGDMVSGFVGAYVGYRLFARRTPVQLVVTPDRGTTVGLQVRTP